MTTGAWWRLLGVVALAGVLALAMLVVHRYAPKPTAPARPELLGPQLAFSVDTDASVLLVRARKGDWSIDVPLWVTVDGEPARLDLSASALRKDGELLKAHARFECAGALREGTLMVGLPLGDADAIEATLSVEGAPLPGEHAVSLRAEVTTGGHSAFLSRAGEISDLGSSTGGLLLVDAEPMTLGFAARAGPIEVSGVVDDPDEVGTPMRLAVVPPAVAISASAASETGLLMTASASSQVALDDLYRITGEHAVRVHGAVSTAGHARIYGLDAEGIPELRVDTDPTGKFTLHAPPTVVLWYAALGSSLTSNPVRFVPGSSGDLLLDVAPGGTLRVRVNDPDAHRPLTARVIVRGEGSTIDPTFGPDYRASGAGPLIDALRGEVSTPLPAGHYIVSATKGIEWNIDGKSVEVRSAETTLVDLSLRYVVGTPGLVGCDLHVHARPSFDAPVTPEDRVLSLVAAGIGFAVPSEHNLVGDYGPALAAQDLGEDLAYVTGIEVTTYAPRFGHFGVYPYPKGPVPRFRGSTPSLVFDAAHRDPNRILQVNHPRLPKNIGYFNVYHYDPHGTHVPPGMRMDFDALEVYNGFDEQTPARVDQVLADWFALLNQNRRYVATGSSDSHRIQYQWAGYPRTMVSIPHAAEGEAGAAVDPLAVVSSLKKGHAFVTSGPIIDLDVDGGHPGDEASAVTGTVRVHVTVRAAPWVDVSSVDVVVEGRVAKTLPVVSRPTQVGPEPGSLDEARARMVRLDETFDIEVGAADDWIVVVARGKRSMGDVLPFMAVPPLAFTNPVWLLHDPRRFFGPPKK